MDPCSLLLDTNDDSFSHVLVKHFLFIPIIDSDHVSGGARLDTSV